ncbi:3-hydroxyacyl-CoA-acyl carrier protein transferase [Pseudomonas coronafaciens pv. oryzae]|nr:3-hydroxyacyl-CoA-acyl carrier protein transferase [Pseudomonas coronafaciens pv. oryzae]KPZ25895.1 3-hydroxyacyl-CoA-acyl carrier protein transferase [Pseudomonas coronafaciens pv. zizaniae]QIQ70204.1 Rhamnosyltransferase 1 subunit A [Pseudomonas coronafaciens]RMM83459.1 3-hydroxyacyl-CoA-acyl carrier protein transferase [Pseudomonas coronafaciens pv. striafaciens]RMN89240.1 3-hydroxyacyl-CoA-acyl carrier protein transferase [Pseudomonas coronafaciens pv. coronafaciens]RMP22676.1 3-hydroxy
MAARAEKRWTNRRIDIGWEAVMGAQSKILSVGNYKVYTETYWKSSDAKTILLVNGALSTTGSFGQTVKYLQPHYNLVLFDLPFSGQSRAHNPDEMIVSKEDEVHILLQLIDLYQVNYLLSVSWGGVSALLALAECPPSVEKAIISSFSPVLNAPMLDYIDKAQVYLAAREKRKIGSLLNDTVGKHLPRLFKLYNYKHLISLAEHEYGQIDFHISQIRKLSASNYVERFSSIDIPVLFINGEKDEYTTVEDARMFSNYIAKSSFNVVPDTGHFLDLESKAAWHHSQKTALSFLGTEVSQQVWPSIPAMA